MQNRTIVTTQDGSHTIYDPIIKSHFHSIYGAITESKHVFIQNGLDFLFKSKSAINVFEFGFGTGLNAYLSFLYSKTNSTIINYHTIESNPLELEIAVRLNYPELLSENSLKSEFMQFHTCEWNIKHLLSLNFLFQKIKGDWASHIGIEKYDLVFFDAFDPVSQPELWSLASFEKLFKMMNENAILCTYCAKGSMKRNLKEVGFIIESLPGPPGKREMTRATRL